MTRTFFARMAAALLPVLCGTFAAAQRPAVNVTLVLKPPFSAYVKDYQQLEGKAIITLTNLTASARQIYLKGSLVNESAGLYIRSGDRYRSASPITLGPNQTRVITADAGTMRFLDEGNAVTNADDRIKQNIIRTGQLPEGIYRVCVRAYDYNGDAPLSDENAGCATAVITLAGPPQITFPLNGMELPEEQKIVNFAWTPPLGNIAGGKISYHLIVVEVPPGQNPNETVRGARDFNANNPVIQRKKIMTQSYTRQPYDLEIKPGKTYAVQVVATDDNGKLVFLNEGRSEVIQFRTGLNKKPELVPTVMTGNTVSTKSIGKTGGVGTLPLFYQDPPPSPLFVIPTVSGKLSYYFASAGTGKSSPLANTTVKLVLAYQMENPTGEISKLLPNKVLPGKYDELAVTKTNADGSFLFVVANLDKIDFSLSKTDMQIFYGTGEFKSSIKGKYRRVLRVMVDDQYYCNPDDVKTCSGNTCDMGTLYSKVKDMSLTVNVQSQQDKTSQSGMEVLLLRIKRPAGVPKDEATPGSTAHTSIAVKGISYELLQKGTTNSEGNIVFSNLVLFDMDNPNDRYFIYARVQEDNTKYSITEVTPLTVKYAVKGDYDNTGIAVAANWRARLEDQEQPSATYSKIEAYNRLYTTPDKPRIYGTVKNLAAGVSNSSNNQGEGLVTLRLFRLSSSAQQLMQKTLGSQWAAALAKDPSGLLAIAYNGELETEIKTPNTGKFNLKNLGTEYSWGKQAGYFRFLVVEKAGFAQQIIPVKKQSGGATGDLTFVRYGEAFNMGDISISPTGMVGLQLVNEDGDPVQGKIYYYDQAASQVGTVAKTNTQGAVSVLAPAGKEKIVIIPDNLDEYLRDTIPMDVENIAKVLFKEPKKVIVYYKLHRIHLVVTDKKTNKPLQNAKVTLLNTNAKMYTELYSPYAKTEDPSTGKEPEKSSSSSGSKGKVTSGTTIGSNIKPGTKPGAVNTNKPPAAPAAVYSIYDRFTNKGGGVDFAFKSSGSEFTFLITAPDNTEYVTTSKKAGNSESASWQYVLTQMEPGRVMTGTVKLGQVVISGARVRVDMSTSKEIPDNEAYTGNSGTFTLHNVPLADLSHTVTFTASKQGYIGDVVVDGETKSVNTQIGGKKSQVLYKSFIENNNISFNLSTYNDINLSKLLGFPVEVTELKENTAKKSVTISGIIPAEGIPDNEVFKSKSKKAFKFSLLEVVPDVLKDEAGKPFGKPGVLPVVTDLNNWDVTVNGYYGVMRDGKGLRLDAVKGDGAIKGYIDISMSSFQPSNFKIQKDGQLYLVDFSQSSSGNLLIPAFTASGKSVYGSQSAFGVCNKDGSAFKYQLYGFDAEADVKTSTLTKEQLTLNTIIHTKLKNVSNPDLKLSLGKVGITAKEIKAPADTKGFDITLDKFKLTATKLTLNAGGLQFDGNLAAGGLTLPFKNASLQPESFMIPDKSLKVDEVKLLGVKPVKITAPASFGYDDAKKAWSVSISGNGQAGVIKDLDGLAPGAAIPLASVYLYSNGQSKYNLAKDPGVYKIHNIADFTPSSIMVYDNSFEIPGVLNIGIPDFPTYTSSLQYDRVNDELSGLKLGAFGMDPVKVNGVVIHFKDKKSSALVLSKDQAVIKGTVDDKDPAVFSNLSYTLTKKAAGTELVIDEEPKQTLPLGGQNSKMKVTSLKGKMSVAGKKWNYLYVEGDMPTEMGFKADNRHMRFEVKGDLEVQNQTIALSNIETPFGNMSMQYDMANSRLSGSMQLEQEVSPGSHVSGAAKMVFDKNGFYFLSGGKLKMTNPNMDGSAALLIGNYPQKEGEATQIFQQSSKYFEIFKKLPDGYTGTTDIKGFFFEGGAAVPVPVIPQFDVNVGLVQAALWVKVGGDARLGANFSAKNTFNMGYACFLDAGFKLGASAVVACAGIKVSALAAVDLDGTYSSPSDWKVSATGQVTLSGETWYGAGLYCDSDCDGLCTSDNQSASKTIGLKGIITPGGADYEIYFQ